MLPLKKTSKTNPRLVYRPLKDGRLSLYLEYYYGYERQAPGPNGQKRTKAIRQYTALKLYLIDPPRTPTDRELNKHTLELANQIRMDRVLDLSYQRHGKVYSHNKRIDVLEYFRLHIAHYKRNDLRMFKACLKRFETFLHEHVPQSADFLKFSELTPKLVQQFVRYLLDNSIGEGARSFYQRFKRVIKQAQTEGYLSDNPCDNVRCTVETGSLKKDVLSLDEIRQLAQTKCYNAEVQRAFLFSLYSGLRFCDVEALIYANIDYANKRLSFDQKKTQGHSSKSRVIMPLNDTLSHLVEPKGEKTAKIFNLPAYTTCLFILRDWVQKAGIEKHITWHCARHSFAVNLLSECQTDIKTLSALLGHTSLEHTQKYTRVIDSLKSKAMDGLPQLDI